MLNVGCAMRKRNKSVPALSESLFAAAWSAVGSSELISFVLEEVIARETSETVNPAMQVHCLREAAEAAEDARLAKSFKSADLPKILYALTSEHDKVQGGQMAIDIFLDRRR